MSIGALAIRGSVGPLFVGHGTQKLLGWFDGPGLEGASGYFESLGLRPGRRNAIAAGVVETVGGALLTLGALTPVATTALTATMVTAIRKVHAPNGPWATNGGYEYNVALIAALAAVAETGPGRPSVDAARFPRLKGRIWAALTLGAGIAGSYVATSQRVIAPAPEPQATAAMPVPDQAPAAGQPVPAPTPAPTGAGLE
jgi:putative oxidoreductase